MRMAQKIKTTNQISRLFFQTNQSHYKKMKEKSHCLANLATFVAKTSLTWKWMNFFIYLFIYLTKTTSFTPLTLQYSIHSTLLNIIYSTLLKSLKYLHCFYLLIYLFIYLSIYLSIYLLIMFSCTTNKQTLTGAITPTLHSYLHR